MATIHDVTYGVPTVIKVKKTPQQEVKKRFVKGVNSAKKDIKVPGTTFTISFLNFPYRCIRQGVSKVTNTNFREFLKGTKNFLGSKKIHSYAHMARPLNTKELRKRIQSAQRVHFIGRDFTLQDVVDSLEKMNLEILDEVTFFVLLEQCKNATELRDYNQILSPYVVVKKLQNKFELEFIFPTKFHRDDKYTYKKVPREIATPIMIGFVELFVIEK